MALGDNGATIEASQPDLEQARHTATVAHEVVIKLKTMGIRIDKLSREQEAYLSDYSAGT